VVVQKKMPPRFLGEFMQCAGLARMQQGVFCPYNWCAPDGVLIAAAVGGPCCRECGWGEGRTARVEMFGGVVGGFLNY
jgi:hypothetical protein